MGDLSAGVVVIGNEILSGKVVDTNSPFLASELRPLGVTFVNLPYTPIRVWQAIQEAQGSGEGPRATEQGRELGEEGRGPGFGPTTPEGGQL